MIQQLFISTLCMVYVRHTNARVEPLPQLPENLQYHFDVYKQVTNLEHQPGSTIFWSSLQQYISRFVETRPGMTADQVDFFRQHVERFMEPVYSMHANSSRVKRQAFRPRIRMEIRMMSIRQRREYFRAVNRMKNDRRVSPNLYDVLADFHTGGNIARAHFGPAFPAWHRLYLWLYESFLRLYEPGVTIPYWASVLDNEMQDPTESVLWSNGFFGNGFGEINSGPFRNWRAINPNTVFRRNVGSGPLYTYNDIEAILSKRWNSEILMPTADFDSNFELMHGGPHTFVSGSMNNLNEAVQDPIFYSHHCFVDYLWEQFRIRQRNNGIDPETDYPFNSTDPRFNQQHRPGSMMGFFPNNEFRIDYPQRVGYWNVFFDLVRYRPIPRCPRCGRSPYLYCNSNMTIPRCVSRTVRGMRGQNYVDDLFSNTTSNNATDSDYTCPRKPFLKEIDSTRIPFGSSMNWAYIPVRIISKRPPTYPKFKQYSLYTYNRSRTALPDSKLQFLQQGDQKSYAKCAQHEDSVGKIKIVTYGINYYGMTEEYAVVDNRLGVSQSTGYAVVKTPSGGNPSDAMVSAYDSCGRTCRPFCIKGVSPPSTAEFTGGIRVTSETPLQYGQSYADATLETWYIPSGTVNPAIDSTNVPLTFYCDYASDWIWDGPGGIPAGVYTSPANTGSWSRPQQGVQNVQSSSQQSSTGTRPRNSGRQRTNTRTGNGRRPTNVRRGNVQQQRGTQMTNWNRGMNQRNTGHRGRGQGCVLSHSCMLRVPCTPCRQWEVQQCIQSVQEGICVDGRFVLYDMYRAG